MKRITLILWLLSTTVWTFAYDFQSGDLYYNITSDSTVEVTRGNCTGLTPVVIVIPESVTYNSTTYSVTSIGESAFRECRDFVFEGISGLVSITIPNSVTSIGTYAFYDCWNLTSITIPNSVTSIGYMAFLGCINLTSITIPNSVTSIGEGAFEDCRGLTSVTIPNSVTNIGDYAFSGCSGLTSITIPNGVTSIGEGAFSWCSGLTSIAVESGNRIYDSRTNCNAIIETETNTLIAGCQNTTIHNSVTSIGNGAFLGCRGLTSITIPNNVTSIGERAFYGCSGLTSVAIPNGVTSIGNWAFSSCSGLTSVTIPNSVTSIGSSAFSHCSGLTSVTIPNSVTSIGEWAFSSCSGLTSVTIPNSITSIGEYTFYACCNLTSITIPNSVTSIGKYTFYACWNLTSITIPNSVTSIGNGAFEDCNGLTYVTLGSELQNIGDNAFMDCQNINEITIYATQVPNVVAEREDSTDYGTFQGVSKSAKLHVPAESVEDYKNHPVWGLFNVITAIPYVVTLTCDSIQGSVEGGGSYQPNEQVTITAEPNDGYRFVEWSDGNTENPRTILVTEDITLSATFVVSGTTTQTNNASAEEPQKNTYKVLRNGQMYIIRGEKTYTADGRQIKD